MNQIWEFLLLRFRVRNIASLFITLVCFSTLYGERTNLDPVFWSDYYSFLEATPAELKDIKNRFGILKKEIKQVKSHLNYNTYQIPARHFKRLNKAKVKLNTTPPFSWLVPDLKQRKSYSMLSKMMAGYKDYELIKQVMFKLQRLFPEYVKVYRIGRSTQGRTIYALKISDHPDRQEDEPAFLFNAAHHGNEVLAPEYVLDLAMYLLFGRGQFKDEQGQFWNSLTRMIREQKNNVGTIHFRSNQIQSWLDNYALWFVPVVNPDGYHKCWNKNSWVGRKNGRDTHTVGSIDDNDGVDLNRNYPFFWNSKTPKASSGKPHHHFYRGPRAASEPETQAMMRLAERKRFVVAFSYHTYATRILTPYTIEGSISPSPSPAWLYAEKMIPLLDSHRSERNYITKRSLYPVDGTDQDWLAHTYGTLAYIMEGSYHNPPFDVAQKSIQGLRPAALKALELYEEGPVIVVYTMDQKKRALGRVHIRLAQTVFYENERYTTHPVTGRYDFILEDGGSYTVIAEAKGYQSKKQQVNCNSGHCYVQMILTPATLDNH